ncbi:MAG: hypothetical protein N2C14_24010 [Planctomycetales bacterium]
MPIVVNCPGCGARFQVADKHGGKTGPCPKCKEKIPIPKASAPAKTASGEAPIRDEDVKIHVPAGFGEEAAGRRLKPGEGLRPIEGKDAEFRAVPSLIIGGAALVALIAAWGIGNSIDDPTTKGRAVLVLILMTSVPLSAAAYWILQDRELEPHRGSSMWIRAAICGAIYTSFWLIRGYIPEELTEGDSVWNWVFLAIPFFLAGGTTASLTHDLEWGEGCFHFLFFLLASLLLRGAAGLDWY